MTLDEAIKRYTSNAFYEKSDGNLQGCLEFEQLAEWLKELKRLKEQEPKTEWIPVNERLPKKYTYTLWCASSGCVESDYFNGEYWENAKKFCYDVIAWMPLPEPYNAESE